MRAREYTDILFIGFTGHRNKIVRLEDLETIYSRYTACMWIHGGAEGFDTFVDEFFTRKGRIAQVVRPNFAKYPPKVAPLKRNEVIVDECDILVTNWDGREEGGTFYTVNYAKERKIPIIFLQPVYVACPI